MAFGNQWIDDKSLDTQNIFNKYRERFECTEHNV